MKPIKPARPKIRKAGRPTNVKKGNVKIIPACELLPGRADENSDEQSQLNFWLFASDKRAMGYYGHEIAVLAQEHFKLKSIPCEATISNWLAKAVRVKTATLLANAEELRVRKLEKIELLLRKWMPIAIKDNLQIMRQKKEDGETVDYIDAKAYDEQLKAANLVGKLIMEQAKLEGLFNDIEDDKKQSKSWEKFVQRAVMESIVQHQGDTAKPVAGREVPAITLELSSGDDTIDRLVG